ncbi:BRO-N domain-containing protein [Escherichia coli]|uniref:BRO-N domain-containing protein n=1 Tax=Escherichia coli TaxID=562 RepID=UPI00198B48AD|nr:BRO family protein [Escherichia coli]CAD6037365.1 antirepressor protein [Escherichia coli]CAD6099500.1 antirepressor protein [Escherichia coli]CAD6176026.1 antirepressor protein [Escherichia coli]
MTTQLVFHDTRFNVVEHNSQIWLSSKEIAQALGMNRANGATQIYHRYADEFNESMTESLNLRLSGSGGGELTRKTRIFSLRGAHLIAMFARTPVAKEFRRWVLDILDKEIKQQSQEPPAPAIDVMNFDIYQTVRNGKVTFVKHYRPGELTTADEALALLKARGWLVMPRDELLNTLLAQLMPENLPHTGTCIR